MRGTDSTGRTWGAVQLTGRALRRAVQGAPVSCPVYRLDLGGRPFVTACGPDTLAQVTTRYAIDWK